MKYFVFFSLLFYESCEASNELHPIWYANENEMALRANDIYDKLNEMRFLINYERQKSGENNKFLDTMEILIFECYHDLGVSTRY